MGTSVGTDVFVKYGWRACSVYMMALFAFQLAMLALRGPHCPRHHWFGWVGGFEARKSVVEARNRDNASKSATTPIDEPQPAEKMEEGVERHTGPGAFSTNANAV